MELGRSPGGKEEKIGGASKSSDKLMIGIVEVILTNPVKFGRPSKGPRLADPWAKGPTVMDWLPQPSPGIVIYGKRYRGRLRRRWICVGDSCNRLGEGIEFSSRRGLRVHASLANQYSRRSAQYTSKWIPDSRSGATRTLR